MGNLFSLTLAKSFASCPVDIVDDPNRELFDSKVTSHEGRNVAWVHAHLSSSNHIREKQS